MIKLKTLKDIGNASDPIMGAIREVIRQEAIKWVKDDKRRIELGNMDIEILLRRWMVRLNLTEEDLE